MINKRFMASSYQSDLWLDVSVGNKKEDAYHLVYGYKLNQTISETDIEDAVRALSEKFVDLGSSFCFSEGKLYVYFSDSYKINIKKQKVSSKGEFDRIVNKFVSDRFDLSSAPLWRVLLVYSSDNCVSVWFNFHHMIADGNSLRCYLKFFESFLLKKSSLGPKVESVIFHNDTTNDDKHANAYDDKLKKYCLNTPIYSAYRERDSDKQFFNRIYFSINNDQNKMNNFRFYIGIYAFVLSRILGKNSIVVSYPKNCRSAQSSNSGYCVTQIPMFFDFDCIKSFYDLIVHVEKERLFVRDFETLPFSVVAKKYRSMFPEESCDINLVFSSSFLGSIETFDSSMSCDFQPFYKTAIADIALYNDGDDFLLEWNPEKINRALATTIVNSFKNVIEKVKKVGLEVDLTAVGLLSHADEVAMMHDRINEPCSYMFLHKYIDYWAKIKPESTALESNGVSVLYKELLNQSDMYTVFLQKKFSVSKKDKILVFVRKNLDLFAFILSILKTGAVYIPVDPAYPKERIRYIVSVVKPKVIFANASDIREINGILAEEISVIPKIVEVERCLTRDCVPQEVIVDAEDTAYIIFTSGTTGVPKGVMISHKSIGNFVSAQAKAMCVNTGSVVLNFAPLSFDTSFSEWGVALAAGARLCFSEYKDNTEAVFNLVKDIDRYSVTHAIMTPSLISTLDPESISSLQVLVSAGEPCSNELIKRFANRLSFFNACGPTETTVGTNICLMKDYYDSTFVGKALPGVNEYIVDKYNNFLPYGVVGNIAIGGLCVAKGYISNKELTSERFIRIVLNKGLEDRVYCSGDLGILRSDGNLRILGRLDKQVKIRGFRVELEEIRLAIQKLPNVEQVVVEATANMNNRQIFAYIKPTTYTNDFSKNILKTLSGLLPFYMVPSKVKIVKSFFLNRHGKIDTSKSVVIQDTDVEAMITEKQAFCDNVTMKRLREIWTNILDCTPSLDSSFFECGGDSISAISMVCEVEKSFNIQLKIRDFILNPSLRNLCSLVSNKEENTYLGGETSAEKDINSYSLGSALYTSKNRNYVLLTGGSGFVGSHLLRKLILEGKKVACFIRARSENEAKKKLERACNCKLHDEIKIVLGNLLEDGLGISDSDTRFIENNVEVFCHCACHVNHVLDYVSLRKVNVQGTVKLLNLAAEFGAKFLFLSALSSVNEVDSCGNAIEKFPKELKQKLVRGGYNETKWVCEHLIQQSIKKGLIAKVVRPCSVIPTNVFDFHLLKNDHLILLLKDIVKTGIAPDKLFPIIPLSVDNVSNILISILLRLKDWSSEQQVINLAPSKILLWEDVLSCLKSFCDIKIIPYNAWVKEIKNSSSDRYIFPLLMLYNFDDSHSLVFNLSGNALKNEQAFGNYADFNRDARNSFMELIRMIVQEA